MLMKGGNVQAMGAIIAPTSTMAMACLKRRPPRNNPMSAIGR